MSTKAERLAIILYPDPTTEQPLPLMQAGRSRASRMAVDKLVPTGRVDPGGAAAAEAMLAQAAQNLLSGVVRQTRQGASQG